MFKLRRALVSWLLVFALLVFALLAPLGTAFAAGLDLDGWLDRPEVSTLGVTFFARDCAKCMSEAASWRRLRAKHGSAGLRVIVVATERNGRCETPPFRPDALICDSGTLARSLGVVPGQGASFLYAWNGTVLVDKGDLAQVKKQLKSALATRPRLSIAIASELGPHAENAVRAATKLRFGGRTKEKVDRKPACAGARIPTELRLAARVHDDKLEAWLEDSERSCTLRGTEVDYHPRRPAEAFEEIVERLTKTLRRGLAPAGRLVEAHEVRPLEAPNDGPDSTVPDTLPNPAGSAPARPGRASTPRAFAERWLGTRYRLGSDSERLTDTSAFIRRLYLEVYGVELPRNLNQMYATAGPPTTIKDIAALTPQLREGDLLFWTTHADVPRFVMVYIGNGEIAQAAEVRGVVIDPLPKIQPQYFWLILKRPLEKTR